MSEKLACAKCGSPIERQSSPGRPPIYCGPVCRSAAAYEIRRLQRRLEGLETRLSWLRQERDDWIRDAQGRTPAQQCEAVEAEIREAEARLALLLAEPRGTTLPDKVGA